MQSPQPPNPDASENIAALLRKAADGELTDAERAVLDGHLNRYPEDRNRLAFEQQLRRACGHVLAGSGAPEGLRERVLARVHTEYSSQPVDAPPDTHTDADHDRQVPPGSLWVRLTPMARLAAAAVLLLVAGAFLYQVANIGSGVVAPAQAEHLDEIASFVGKEHMRCVIDPARARKFTIHELDNAPAAFEELIGSSPSFPELASVGLEFLDGGRCHVPGKGDSVHLRFRMCNNPEKIVSLFIQTVADDTDPLFEEGKSYELVRPDASEDGKTIYGWSADGLNYFLVADDDNVCETYLRAVGLASPVPADP